MELFIDSYRVHFELAKGFLTVRLTCPSIGLKDDSTEKGIYDKILVSMGIFPGTPIPKVIKLVQLLLQAYDCDLSSEDSEKIRNGLMAEFSGWYEVSPPSKIVEAPEAN